MARQADLRKLLVLRSPALDSEGITPILRKHFDVHLADQPTEVLKAMRGGECDVVLAETAEFLLAQQGMLSQLAGPINDILAEVTEASEYCAGQDDLHKRLQAIRDCAGRTMAIIHSFDEPCPDAAPSGRGALGAGDPVLADRRVLVADDEEPMRLTIRDVLVSWGSSVDVAADGAEAIRMIEQTGYDLIISDIKMPGATGYEVFAAARKSCPEMPVILITGFGYDPHHSVVRAGGEGLAAVLMKPFRADELLTECRSALVPAAD